MAPQLLQLQGVARVAASVRPARPGLQYRCGATCLLHIGARRRLLMISRELRSGLAAPLALLLLLSGPSAVSAACEGGSCPEQHQAATAAGLLGATACTPKQYPLSGGKVTPVCPLAAASHSRWPAQRLNTLLTLHRCCCSDSKAYRAQNPVASELLCRSMQVSAKCCAAL